MGRRTLLVIASVLIAAAGTALIWVYVQGADARARRGWQELVTVLVATDDIQVGSTSSTVIARTEPKRIPLLLAPDKRVTTRERIGDRATTVPILAGQYLVEGQFAAANSVTGVPEGKMAISVQMEDPARVASLLRPESHIAVYTVTRGKTSESARLLLDDVRVLAVGGTTTLRDAEGDTAKVGTQSNVSTALVTLEVDGSQATKLMAYQDVLYFTLLGKNFKPTTQDDFSRSTTSNPANG